jgi:hypothetical protein
MGRAMTVKRGINKLKDAMDAMGGPDARLIQTFSYYGKPDYWISPAGCRVEQKIAEQIMAHPQVEGGRDALFPGHHQTWRLHGDGSASPARAAQAVRSPARALKLILGGKAQQRNER